MNPRDADHRDLRLAPDSTRMTIVSELRLHYINSLFVSPGDGAT